MSFRQMPDGSYGKYHDETGDYLGPTSIRQEGFQTNDAGTVTWSDPRLTQNDVGTYDLTGTLTPPVLASHAPVITGTSVEGGYEDMAAASRDVKYYSTWTGDPYTDSKWNVWGAGRVDGSSSFENMSEIGNRLGLTPKQIYDSAESAARAHMDQYGTGYEKGSSPLHVQDAIGRNLFAAAGREYQPLFTPAQLAESAALAAKRSKGTSFLDDMMEFIKVPLIFASLILTAGTVSAAIGGTVAGGTAAGAGAVGIGDLTGGAGMGWGAASGAGTLGATDAILAMANVETALGGGATLTATGAAGAGAEYLSGNEFGDLAMQGGGEVFNTEALRGLSVVDVNKIIKTVKGVIDHATMDETGSRYAADAVDNSADAEEDPTDVIENIFEFFNGKLPFNERGGGLLRLSTGERVFDSASKFGRGIINSSRA